MKINGQTITVEQGGANPHDYAVYIKVANEKQEELMIRLNWPMGHTLNSGDIEVSSGEGYEMYDGEVTR